MVIYKGGPSHAREYFSLFFWIDITLVIGFRSLASNISFRPFWLIYLPPQRLHQSSSPSHQLLPPGRRRRHPLLSPQNSGGISEPLFRPSVSAVIGGLPPVHSFDHLVIGSCRLPSPCEPGLCTAGWDIGMVGFSDLRSAISAPQNLGSTKSAIRLNSIDRTWVHILSHYV